MLGIQEMTEQTLVSVIMNCFRRKVSREAIDSVFAQTYQNWELIFWDNSQQIVVRVIKATMIHAFTTSMRLNTTYKLNCGDQEEKDLTAPTMIGGTKSFSSGPFLRMRPLVCVEL